MKQKNQGIYYLCRAVHYLRRAVEIGLFTHTRCPSGVLTELLAQQDKDQALQDRAPEKHVDAHKQSSACESL
jgi:hypothetical protein